MSKLIPLTQGKFAIVDDEDFAWLSQLKWHAQCEHKGMRWQNWNARNRIKGAMHRLILAAPRALEIDHVNGDGLDNRRVNLRLATSVENKRNQRRHTPKTFPFKGVAHHYSNGKRSNRYLARIVVNRRHKFLGSFLTIEEAALAYNAAALKHYGEFARLNQIKE